MKRIIFVSILVVFGSLTGSPFPLGNPKIDAHGFGTPGTFRTDSATESIEEDILVIYLEEVKEPTTGSEVEWFFNSNNSTEPSEARNTEESGMGEKDTKRELTKIRTKIKFVETVLKKAVITTYCVDAQTKGLQINGLDKISEAKALLLKSGDIILTVNGQTLSSKKEAYHIFKKARTQPNMIVELLQDGKAKKVLFDFKGAV